MIAASRDKATICVLLLESGADIEAKDLLGRTALQIAIQTGSLHAADVISAHLTRQTSHPDFNHSSQGSHPFHEGFDCNSAGERPMMLVAVAEPATKIDEVLQQEKQSAVSYEAARPIPSSPRTRQDTTSEETPYPLSATSTDYCLEPDRVKVAPDGFVVTLEAKVDPVDDPRFLEELALGEWEAVEATEAPENNSSLVQAESEKQGRIDRHTPIESLESWEDFEAHLPEFAKPYVLAESHTFRKALRLLVLRAIREGSIPLIAVEDAASLHSNGNDRDMQAELAIEFILGDLGSDVDERLEFSSACPTENFEVFVSEEETRDEEVATDEALQHFDDLISSRNDCLRIYYRSIASHGLLTANEEIDLGQKMANAVELALDSLARWPNGLKLLTSSIKLALADATIMTQIVATNVNAPEAEAADETDSIETHTPESHDLFAGSDEVLSIPGEELDQESPAEIFVRLLDLLANQSSEDVSNQIRDEFKRLKFRRPYLIKLQSHAATDAHPSAAAFKSSIDDLLTPRTQMATANLRLVLDTAKRYVYSGIEFEDLIQDGNLGLLSAVDRYEWQRGFKFSTMAIWWIKQSISRGIADKANAIRLPVHLYERMSKGRWAIESIERNHGRPPSMQERASLCNLSLDKYELAARALSIPESIEVIDKEGSLLSESADEPFDHVARADEVALIEQLLSGLRRKESQVLRLRFGIEIPDFYTLDQIGEIFEVTRERIRQIEGKAIRTLSSSRSLQSLAIALGKQARPMPVQVDGNVDEAETEDDATVEALRTAISSPPDNSAAATQSKPTIQALSNESEKAYLQELINTAWALGVPVSVETKGTQKHYTFCLLRPENGKMRNFVRSLTELGFSLNPGVGYQK
jgi:RNA polymerase primary sigma factor